MGGLTTVLMMEEGTTILRADEHTAVLMTRTDIITYEGQTDNSTDCKWRANSTYHGRIDNILCERQPYLKWTQQEKNLLWICRNQYP